MTKITTLMLCALASFATFAQSGIESATLANLEATYLQGNGNPAPNGPILRVEEGNRLAYLKFDLSDFSGTITEAILEMQVASDPGSGTLEVFLGSHSNWTERGLNGDNKPAIVGTALASIDGTHSIGQTKLWNLDVSSLATGREITLIITHSNGNDVAFASDDSENPPKLNITTSGGATTQRPFITTWRTQDAPTNPITIPTYPGAYARYFPPSEINPDLVYDYTVDWGDGSVDTNVTGDITHNYEVAGTYTISITGSFPRIFFNYTWDDGEVYPYNIISIDQWGDIEWDSMGFAFRGCSNLDVNAVDAPNLSKATSLYGMFWNSGVVGNASFNTWDVSTITDMRHMFQGTAFNQNISGWDVSNVETMSYMFAESSFNQPLNDWDMGQVEDISLMFSQSSFNQPLDNWDVSNVEFMVGVFGENKVFNQPIGNWDVGNVNDLGSMFSNATAFNQDLSAWDVSNVGYMSYMFYQAISFNQSIGGWDVSKVDTMQDMFNGATSFNQDLGDWNIQNVNNFDRVFTESGLSNENYDQTLISWGQLPSLQSGVDMDAPNNQYCLAEEARQSIIDNYNWTINDSGKAEDCDSGNTAQANLIEGTYLQGNSNPAPTGPILRVEEGNRLAYLKFDLSDISGTITDAVLEMEVSNDPGSGTLEVFLGSHSNWTEHGLNGNNKPATVGTALASINGTHSIGQTKTWNLDVSSLATGEELTLIIKHSNGNDVAFASDETSNAPTLRITTGGTTTQRPFITTWKTDNPGLSEDNQITIHTHYGETYNYVVDWGDGTMDEQVTGDITHTYDVPGTYTVSISGDFPRIYFASDPEEIYRDNHKILTVEQWGDIQWTSMEYAFAGCDNLDVPAADVPDLSKATSLIEMFSFCSNLIGTPRFGDWQVGNVINMRDLFSQAERFNQPLADWDVSNVENMSGMFSQAEEFNQPIGNWDVSNVTTMHAMFAGNTAFDQEIGEWDVSSATMMSGMFIGASAFNQPIQNWDVSGVIYMQAMFSGASSFNQNIGDWDVSKAQNMNSMFFGATAFNVDIGNWEVSEVQDMRDMFTESGLSDENYERLLFGWSELPSLQDEVVLDAPDNQFCFAEDARQRLRNVYGWAINDGGKAENCELPGAEITGFTLVNADTNSDLFEISSGQQIRLEELPTTNLNFRANVAGEVGSVYLRLDLDGTVEQTRTEGVAPYALFGDRSGNYIGRNMQTGDYILSAIPYSEGQLGGEEGLFLAVSFSIVSTSTALQPTISLFPNPTQNQVTLEFEQPTEVQSAVLYDVLGRPVPISSTEKNSGAVEAATYDVSQLPQGTYFLKVVDTAGTMYEKTIIKE